jgi:hypothetical protein
LNEQKDTVEKVQKDEEYMSKKSNYVWISIKKGKELLLGKEILRWWIRLYKELIEKSNEKAQEELNEIIE